MPEKRILSLAAALVLILACNLPQPGAKRTAQNTQPPATTSPTRRSTDTRTAEPELPSVTPTRREPAPTATPHEITLPAPTEEPPVEPVAATVDEFFERCPTAAEIQSILADISFTFEVDPTAGTLACRASEGSLDLSPLKKRAYQSFLIMKYIAFDAPLPWTEKSLYAWFVGSIKGVRLRSDIPNSFCCGPLNTINILVADNSYLMLTDRWIDPQMGGGLMDTMVLYVHEARHNEGYGHMCPGGNDRTLSEMSAWGVQYYLLQWLAQHADPDFFRAPGGNPDYYRLAALDHMLSIRRTRFCDEPALTPGASPTLTG
jgi:hypothetical protein